MISVGDVIVSKYHTSYLVVRVKGFPELDFGEGVCEYALLDIRRNSIEGFYLSLEHIEECHDIIEVR